MNIFRVLPSSLNFAAAGFLSLLIGLESQAQDTALKENDVRPRFSWLRSEGTEVLSPEFRRKVDARFRFEEFLDVSRELQQHADRRDHNRQERTVSIQQLEADGQERPEGPPRGRHPDPREQGRDDARPERLRAQHYEHRGPEGTFEEEHRRIQALSESAERIAQAGLPDVAHELRQRAERLEREVAARRELMERLRDNNRHPEMPQLRRGNEFANPPIHELHEQMGRLRRDMHKLSEQMEHLTDLIQKSHKQGKYRHHRADMDDDDDDHQDRDDADEDERHQERNDRDDDRDDEDQDN